MSQSRTLVEMEKGLTPPLKTMTSMMTNGHLKVLAGSTVDLMATPQIMNPRVAYLANPGGVKKIPLQKLQNTIPNYIGKDSLNPGKSKFVSEREFFNIFFV